jgi:hypothetical protein
MEKDIPFACEFEKKIKNDKYSQALTEFKKFFFEFITEKEDIGRSFLLSDERAFLITKYEKNLKSYCESRGWGFTLKKIKAVFPIEHHANNRIEITFYKLKRKKKISKEIDPRYGFRKA